MSIPGYEILSERCRCNLAVCYQARQLATGRLVCLEMFRTWEGAAHLDGDSDGFRRQLEMVALLEHPNILPILGVDRFDAVFYMVRPFVEGEFLSEHLRDGHFEARQAARLVRQAADAVRHAHEHGIFHPDLSPHDLLVTRQGEVLLTRFESALVRFLHPPSSSPEEGREGVVMGNPACLAPEQIRGEPPCCSPYRDIWVLGTLLFWLATGRRPFEGHSGLDMILAVLEEPVPRPRSLRPDLDADLEAVILRCLQKKPENRYPDVPHLLADLDCYLDDRPPVRADRLTLAGRMSRWVRGWWGATQSSG